MSRNIHEDLAAVLAEHGAPATIEALRDAIGCLGTHAAGTFAGKRDIQGEADRVCEWLTAAANATVRIEDWTVRRLATTVADANDVIADALAVEA